MPRFTPICYSNVKITDDFWSRRQRVNQERSLPKQYEMCERSGRLDALTLKWKLGMPNEPHIYWDSDTAKWLEAACYACRIRPDDELRAKIDHVAALFVGAQLPDGYLNSHFAVKEWDQRWKNLRMNHELYCAGHLFEAAVAHHELTGTDSLLNAACRYADYIDSIFGAAEGKIPGYCGHEEIELALVRLYRATDNRRYLDLASFFVEQRGQRPHYFDIEAGDHPIAFLDAPHSYFQAHAPVREQASAEGHAVRAMYLYCAMTDLAQEKSDETLLAAVERLWSDVISTKLYVTGGLGSNWEREAFSVPYFLPNDRAYCETCASVAFIFWAQRMAELTGERTYVDELERALYNSALAGMSLDGESFFYQNPLASDGTHHRQSWFDCSCCPSNLSRLLATLGSYVYAESDSALRVNLYIGSEAEFAHGRVRQTATIPSVESVKLEFDLTRESNFVLELRIPDWSSTFAITVNGAEVDFENITGFIRISRTWRNGDIVQLSFSLRVRRIYSHPKVVSNAGQVALQYGPFFYCIEATDFEGAIEEIRLPRATKFLVGTLEIVEEKLPIIEGDAMCLMSLESTSLYHSDSGRTAATQFRAIPYFAWDNRTPGSMRVWIPEA